MSRRGTKPMNFDLQGLPLSYPGRQAVNIIPLRKSVRETHLVCLEDNSKESAIENGSNSKQREKNYSH